MTKLVTVYSLREKLGSDPEFVKTVQALSLNPSKPNMGLSTRLGLFGSAEWWQSVEAGHIKRAEYFGVITETFYAGMDSNRRHNSFRMKTDDGREYSYGMLPEKSSFRELYARGHRAEVVTIFQELKKLGPDGSPDLLESPLEIRLSNKPIT